MSKKFEQQLAELGITLTQTQFNQFDKYYEMLVEWNKVMNLTGITEYEEVNEKHYTFDVSNIEDKRKAVSRVNAEMRQAQ